VDTNGNNFVMLKSGLEPSGSSSPAGLVEGGDGALYGRAGGGVIFGLTRDGSSYAVLHTFTNNTASEYSPLTFGSDGALYGTTSDGGDKGVGQVFRLDITGVVSPPTLVFGPTISSNQFVARFSGTLGATYTIEYTPSLSPANWQKLTNQTAPATDQGLGVGVFELRSSSSNAPQRFYREVYPAY